MLPADVSENDNAGMALIYNQLGRYAAMLDASLVLIHYSTKGAQSDKRVTDVGAGAGSQSRAADCHLVLREHEEPGCVVLDAAVRSFAPVEPLVLRWEFPLWVPDEDADPVALKATKQAQTNSQRDQRLNDKPNRVVAYLATARETGATKSAIRDHTGINSCLGQVVDSLVKDGNCVTCEVVNPTNKQVCKGWKLATNDEQTQSDGQIRTDNRCPSVGAGGRTKKSSGRDSASEATTDVPRCDRRSRPRRPRPATAA